MASTIRAEEITSIIQQEIEGYQTVLDVKEIGTVLSIGDGVAQIHGLEKVMYGELIDFPHNVVGIAFNLNEDSVGAILLGDFAAIKSGDQVKRTGKIYVRPGWRRFDRTRRQYDWGTTRWKRPDCYEGVFTCRKNCSRNH